MYNDLYLELNGYDATRDYTLYREIIEYNTTNLNNTINSTSGFTVYARYKSYSSTWKSTYVTLTQNRPKDQTDYSNSQRFNYYADHRLIVNSNHIMCYRPKFLYNEETK